MKRSDLKKYTTFIWSRATENQPPSVAGDILHKSEIIFLNIVVSPISRNAKSIRHVNKGLLYCIVL